MSRSGLPLRLKPTDYFADAVITSDENYFYRFWYGSGGRLERIPKNNRGTSQPLATFASFGAGASPTTEWMITSTGIHLILVVIDNVASIFRSADGGATFTKVGDVGAIGLGGNRSWAEHDGVVYFGEYDPPGTSAVLTLWKITNNFTELSPLHQWEGSSTDPTTPRAIKHIHFVGVFKNHLYVGVGDNDAQSGIFRWDFEADWADIGNIAPKDVNSLGIAGFRGVGGDQKYRTTDIAEFKGKLFSFADAGSGSLPGSKGIFSFNHDLTGWHCINNDVLNYAEYAGYWALSTPEQVLFIPYVSTTGGLSNDITIWASSDGKTCKPVAVFRCQNIAAQKNPYAFFYDNGEIVLTVTPAAGKPNQKGSAVFVNTDDVFKGARLDVIHPVIWTDPINGVDSATGFDPRVPKKTLFGCLSTSSSARVPQACCVMLKAGLYQGAGFTYAQWTTTNYPAENVYTQVRGEGRDKTIVDINSGSVGITQGGENRYLLFTDLMYYVSAAITANMWAGSATFYGEFETQDCTIGRPTDIHQRCLYPRDSKTRHYRSYLFVQPVTNKYVVACQDAATETYTANEAEFYACVLSGGEISALQNNSGKISIYQGAVVDYLSKGLSVGSAALNKPAAFGTVFFTNSTDANRAPMRDSAGQTWDESNMNYNLFDMRSNGFGVPDGELGRGSVVDARIAESGYFFTDPTNYDFSAADGAGWIGMQERYADFGINGVEFSHNPIISPFGDYVKGSGGSSISGAMIQIAPGIYTAVN